MNEYVISINENINSNYVTITVTPGRQGNKVLRRGYILIRIS